MPEEKILVFPHHENEIAQSEGATGKPFAKYWMHNRFLNINNQKMSKSLGNFFTVREVAERYGYDAIRFFMLNAHYRSPVNFSAELMEAACSSLERIRSCYGNLKYLESTAQNRPLTEQEKQWITDAAEYQTKFEAAMDNDFNTADALAAIFELVRFANTKAEASSSLEFLAALAEQLGRLMEMLGFTVEVKEELLDEEIEALIEPASAGAQSAQFCLGRRNSGYIEGKGHCPGRHARGRSIQASIGETTGLDEFFNTIREQEAPQNWKAQQCSPIALAFLGDTVFDLYLRTKLVLTSRVSANAMHLKASSYAKAASQARMMHAIEERLTPEEQGDIAVGAMQNLSVSPKMRSSQIIRWQPVSRRSLDICFWKDGISD